MHRHGIAIACCLALLLAMALPAGAQAPGPGPQPSPMPQGQPGPPLPPPAFWKDAKAVEELQLTADQVAKMEKLDAAFRDDSMAVRSDLETAHLELQLAFRRDKLDEKAIRALAAKVGVLESRMAVLHVAQQLRVKLVLNPAQRKKLDQFQPPMGGPRPHCEKGPHEGGRP